MTAVFAGAGTNDWTSPRLALLLVMGVLLVSIVAQVAVQPHAVEALNRLELLSLLCTTFTCIAGIFFGVPGRARGPLSPAPMRASSTPGNIT